MGTSPTFSYSHVSGNWAGEGNISTNPLFLDPDNDNYRVCAESSCVDAGDPSITDPDGSRSDIGVFFPVRPDCQAGSTWHVSMSGDDTSGDGSPLNPFRTIQHAIDVSFYYDTIIVANGVYSEHIVFAGLAAC